MRGGAVFDLSQSPLPPKLWLYTNFDCNIGCSYCVTQSTPAAPRRALGLATVQRLVDEGVDIGFRDVFFTGGEPFLLDEIHEMLAYSSARVTTTILTNAIPLSGKRLDRLCAIANENLSVQVSLDGSRPEEHDAYRGQGTWTKTVTSIRRLLARGIHVCISTTETPANSARIDELHMFRRGLGIPDEDHFVRPLAKRGFSCQGLEVGRENLEPELTVTVEGVYWHPLTFPGDVDMQVRAEVFPLIEAVECIEEELRCGGGTPRTEFT
jgi:MoaA/NifB/PqqE/SkfB family radical SAM enzyme